MSDEPLSPAAGVAVPGAEPLRASLDAQVAERTAKWLAAATDAASPDTQLFARLIAARDVRDELALLGVAAAGVARATGAALCARGRACACAFVCIAAR